MTDPNEEVNEEVNEEHFDPVLFWIPRILILSEQMERRRMRKICREMSE